MHQGISLALYGIGYSIPGVETPPVIYFTKEIIVLEFLVGNIVKVYLDDERNIPPMSKQVLVRTAPGAIELLKTGLVTEIDLDHDLGRPLTGGDVLAWIEKETARNTRFNPPKIRLHTQNSSARESMLLAIKSIKKLVKERK